MTPDNEMSQEELNEIVLAAEKTSLLALGPKVRVTRVIVYEGDAAAIASTLAMSLPHGTRESHRKDGVYSITVYEHSRVAIEDGQETAEKTPDPTPQGQPDGYGH